MTRDHPALLSWPAGHVDPFAGWGASAPLLRAGQGRKLWCRPGDAPGWCRLYRPDGAALELSRDPARVPYLGLWIDNRAYARERVLAPEPATGWHDDLDRARRLGRVPRVQPGHPCEWHLDVRVWEAS